MAQDPYQAEQFEADVIYDSGSYGATQVLGRTLTLRARLDNVMNESDWVSVGGYPGSNCPVLGAPQIITISASAGF